MQMPRQLDKSDYMAHHKLLEKIEKQIRKLPWPEAEQAATPKPVLKLHELRGRLQQQLVELKKRKKRPWRYLRRHSLS